jgi:NAD(P)-dependent dehydrogenase (short-subunit alcohol dehydrogenase family)
MPDDNLTHVLITGANRGLGLALTREYLARGDQYRVLACCRRPASAPELEQLRAAHPKNLRILRLEVGLGRAAKATAEAAADLIPRLDVLINNAGLAPGDPADTLADLDLPNAREAFNINAIGPVRVTRAFLPLLRRRGAGAKVVNISSGLGSLTKEGDPGDNPWYIYAATKAALNKFTRLMARELGAEGMIVVAITPGWVRTDMGGSNADLSPEESASALVGAIEKLTPEQNSLFLDRNGEVSAYAW